VTKCHQTSQDTIHHTPPLCRRARWTTYHSRLRAAIWPTPLGRHNRDLVHHIHQSCTWWVTFGSWQTDVCHQQLCLLSWIESCWVYNLDTRPIQWITTLKGHQIAKSDRINDSIPDYIPCGSGSEHRCQGQGSRHQQWLLLLGKVQQSYAPTYAVVYGQIRPPPTICSAALHWTMTRLLNQLLCCR
jgi:hypothetical protein